MSLAAASSVASLHSFIALFYEDHASVCVQFEIITIGTAQSVVPSVHDDLQYCSVSKVVRGSNSAYPQTDTQFRRKTNRTHVIAFIGVPHELLIRLPKKKSIPLIGISLNPRATYSTL